DRQADRAPADAQGRDRDAPPGVGGVPGRADQDDHSAARGPDAEQQLPPQRRGYSLRRAAAGTEAGVTYKRKSPGMAIPGLCIRFQMKTYFGLKGCLAESFLATISCAEGSFLRARAMASLVAL